MAQNYIGNPVIFMDSRLGEKVDFGAVFEHVPVAICVSQERTILACNDAAAQLFSFSREYLIGKSTSFLYPSTAEFERFGRQMTAAIAATGTHADERIMKRGTGALFWCRVSGTLLDKAAASERHVWTFHEVGAHRKVYEGLSPREREIAALLVAGNTSKMIAGKVGLSPRTVEFYRQGLMRKLSANSFSDLICRLATDLRQV